MRYVSMFKDRIESLLINDENPETIGQRSLRASYRRYSENRRGLMIIRKDIQITIWANINICNFT